eukprot:2372805-Rhodomonas_salina.1
MPPPFMPPPPAYTPRQQSRLPPPPGVPGVPGAPPQRGSGRQPGVHFPNAKMLVNGVSRSHDKKNACSTCQ